MATKPKRETGIHREVTFRGWCHRVLCDWQGPKRDMRSMAAYDLAYHELDVHGGAVRE